MRVSLVRLLQAAAVVTAVFSIGTLLPLDHFALQLFVHFRPQYLVASILLLILLSALRQPTFAIVMLLVAALNTSFVLPWYLGAQPTSGYATLTVMQANLLSRNSDHARVFEMLDSEQPDLVVFQEVSSHWLMALAELAARYPYSYAEAREGNFGIALFSRVPFASVTHIDSPPLGYPTIIARLRVGEDLLNVIATHPTIPISGNVYEARNQQLDSLHEVLEGLEGSTVLMGDLNTTMWEPNYRTFVDRAGLRNARRGFGVVPTWPTFMPFAMIPIDHVLVSDDIEVSDVHTGPRIGSDHLPLVVTLHL